MGDAIEEGPLGPGANARVAAAEDRPVNAGGAAAPPNNRGNRGSRNAPSTLQIASRSELAIRRFAEFCRNRTWGSLLYHKVGTGKTIASLLIALNYVSGTERKIVVVAPPGLFRNFQKDLREAIDLPRLESRLVDYPYPELIEDINKRNFEKLKIFEGNIAIFDEAHRLLSEVVLTSSESGSDTNRHAIFVDLPFQHAVYKAERCILLTGTPVQKDFADICMFMNFLKRTNSFTTYDYAPKTLEQYKKKKLLELARLALGAARREGIATTLLKKLVPGYATLSNMSGSGIKEVIQAMLIQIGAPVSIVGAVKIMDDLIVDSLLAKVQDATETLDENIYDIDKLLNDSRDVISLYDYEIQKEFLNLQDFLQRMRSDQKVPLLKYGIKTPYNTATKNLPIPNALTPALPTKPPPPNLSFPQKLVTISTQLYDSFQYDLLSRMYMGLLEDVEKDIFYVNQYLKSNSASTAAIGLNRLRAQVIGRVIGNLSEDIYHYTTTLTDDKRKYKAVHRVNGEPKTDASPVFECRKFKEVLEILKTSATGTSQVTTYNPADESGRIHVRTDTYYPHPHRKDGGTIYLPIVYSFTEELGTALFAAYLDSLGYKYILIHQEQTKDTLAEQINRATQQTYRPIEKGAEFPDDRPICAILHPKMTEGINCTYNPEIVLLDVCNTYGDMEQVHGRVLRRYSPGDVAQIEAGARARGVSPAPTTKLIHQMICDSKSDHEVIRTGLWDRLQSGARIFGYAGKKFVGIPGQRGFYEFGDFKSWILKFRAESPDLNGYRRLLKEEEYLTQFTEGLLENDVRTIREECGSRDHELCSQDNLKKGRCGRGLEEISQGRRTYKIRFRGLGEGLRPKTDKVVFAKGSNYQALGVENVAGELNARTTGSRGTRRRGWGGLFGARAAAPANRGTRKPKND
jgi:hypothetical protein